MRKYLPIFIAALLIHISCASQPEPPKPTSHTTQDIEGWTVHVDDRLLNDPKYTDLGKRALLLLRNRLQDITILVPEPKVARLRQVIIWLDATHGQLTSMQYHPNPRWLENNGYSTNLANAVHIPSAARFADPNHHRQQPWCVLHELAHAYHHQVLDFENPEIKAAWEKFRDSGRYDSTLHINGKRTRHYALTNQKEFFAEMTEVYFGMNDFFPFNRAELLTEEPEIHALLKKIWEE